MPVTGHDLGLEDDPVARRRGHGPRQLLGTEQAKQRRLGQGQQGREGGDDGALEAAGLEEGVDLVEQHLEVERHHELGVAVLHLLGQLGDGIEGVEIDDGAAGLQDGKEEDDEGGGVGQEQPDLGALPDPEPLQPERRPVDLLADLRVGEGFAEKVGAVEVAEPVHRVVEQPVQRRDLKRHVPIDAARVVIEPRHGRLRRVGRWPGADHRSHPRCLPGLACTAQYSVAGRLLPDSCGPFLQMQTGP